MTAAALATWAAGPALAAGWALQTTPNPSGSPLAELYTVSCTSASACTAVGDDENSAGTAILTLAERWNGSTWTVQTTVNPAGGEDSLGGVSCTSATSCEAVGGTATGTLAEFWNGSTWALQTTPSPAGSSLSSVSCTSAANCEAVGGDSTGTLAEHWNGSTWATQTTPSTGASLESVSCPSATSCNAVGFIRISGQVLNALAEHWNGSTWALQTIPDPSQAASTVPTGISCASTTSCVAVGYYTSSQETFTLTETWNGTTWAVSGGTGTGGGLSAVSCVSAAFCTAVGSQNSSNGRGATFATHWNGTSWAAQTTVNPSGSAESGLNGVACPTTVYCSAVGSYYISSPSLARTLGEGWT